MPARCFKFIAMEADLGGEAKFAAREKRLFQVRGDSREFGERTVPSAYLEKTLSKDTVCLCQPHRGSDLIREQPGPFGCPQGFIA